MHVHGGVGEATRPCVVGRFVKLGEIIFSHLLLSSAGFLQIYHPTLYTTTLTAADFIPAFHASYREFWRHRQYLHSVGDHPSSRFFKWGQRPLQTPNCEQYLSPVLDFDLYWQNCELFGRSWDMNLFVLRVLLILIWNHPQPIFISLFRPIKSRVHLCHIIWKESSCNELSEKV